MRLLPRLMAVFVAATIGSDPLSHVPETCPTHGRYIYRTRVRVRSSVYIATAQSSNPKCRKHDTAQNIFCYCVTSGFARLQIEYTIYVDNWTRGTIPRRQVQYIKSTTIEGKSEIMSWRKNIKVINVSIINVINAIKI